MSVDWDAIGAHYATRLLPNPRGTPESRAVSALLSMVQGVSEFGAGFVSRCGGPKYKGMATYLRSFTEVPFTVLSGEQAPGQGSTRRAAGSSRKREYARPDGVIVVQKGSREWKAMIELKVGASKLADDPDQIAEYHRQASALGYDALITVSGESAQVGSRPPRGLESAIDGRRLRRCPVVHLSWRDLLGDAQALLDADLEENVEDADQAWMLGEWIRYVTDDGSGILESPSLGSFWSDVLEQAQHGRLTARCAELEDVASHWIGYSGEIGYRLRLLGIRVTPSLSRKERDDPSLLLKRVCDEGVAENCLKAQWRMSGPVDLLSCTVHMGRRKIHYALDVSTFDGKTSAARLMSWLGQLDPSRVPDEVCAITSWRGTRKPVTFAVSDVEGARQLQSMLQEAGIDRSGVPTRLTLEWVTPLPRKKGQKGAAHLDAITQGMVRFYGGVAAGLRAVERMPGAQRRSRPAKSNVVRDSDDEPTSTAENGAPSEPEIHPIVHVGFCKPAAPSDATPVSAEHG